MNPSLCHTNLVLFHLPSTGKNKQCADAVCLLNDNRIFIRCLSSHFGRQLFLLPAIQKGSKKMNVPTIDIAQTGANIKALRKAAGIKVKDVADTLGVSTQAVAKWQAGTALPTIDNLVILAAMLDTKIDDILVIA